MVTRRRFLAGAVGTATVAGACGGNGTSGSGGYQFSYLRPTWGPATYTKNGPYQRELQERAGVEIDVQIIPVVEFDEKVNTILASGDLPDVIWSPSPGHATWPNWRDARDQGAFLPIDEHLDRHPAVREAVPDDIWDMLRDDHGDSYLIPNLIWPEVPFLLFYRQDLFDEAGIEEPSTVEEFEQVLDEASQAYPDMVPFALGYEWSAKDLATAFDLCLNGWESSPQDPETIIPWWAKEPEIDFYFWLQRLHKNGTLDPDFKVSDDPNVAADDFKAGKSVILAQHWSEFPDTLTTLREVEPSAEIGIMSPLGEHGGNRQVTPIDRGFFISSEMDDPDGFFEFLEWTLTDGDTFRRWGIEGETYRRDDDRNAMIPENQRDDGFKQPQLEPLGFVGPYDEKLDWEQTQLDYEGAELEEYFDYVKEKFEEYIAQYRSDYRDPTVVSETEERHGVQIFDDYLEQITESAIIDHDVTKNDWLEAVEKWREAGGDDIIAEVNEVQEDKSEPNYAES